MSATSVPPATPTTAAPAPAAALPAGVPAAPPVAAPVAPPATTTPATPAAPAAPAATAAPVVYAFKDAEGKPVESDVTKAYAEIAGKHKVSPEAAQEILSKVSPVLQQQLAAQAEATRQSWLDASTADPEFGGANLKSSLELAAKTFALGRPTLGAFLKETGLDNHPELVAWAVAVGKRLSPDSLGTAAPPTSAPPTGTPANGFYPSMRK